MNPTHRTRRLSVTLAGLAAAALALPACQSTATAASHRPRHHSAQAMVQQAQNGLTVTDLTDLANVKRDLQARAQQRGMTVEDLQDLAKIKRGLIQR
jgi:RNA polymerase-interacting CarD/CdnL/TRCF family regulator